MHYTKKIYRKNKVGKKTRIKNSKNKLNKLNKLNQKKTKIKHKKNGGNGGNTEIAMVGGGFDFFDKNKRNINNAMENVKKKHKVYLNELKKLSYYITRYITKHVFRIINSLLAQNTGGDPMQALSSKDLTQLLKDAKISRKKLMDRIKGNDFRKRFLRFRGYEKDYNVATYKLRMIGKLFGVKYADGYAKQLAEVAKDVDGATAGDVETAKGKEEYITEIKGKISEVEGEINNLIELINKEADRASEVFGIDRYPYFLGELTKSMEYKQYEQGLLINLLRKMKEPSLGDAEVYKSILHYHSITNPKLEGLVKRDCGQNGIDGLPPCVVKALFYYAGSEGSAGNQYKGLTMPPPSDVKINSAALTFKGEDITNGVIGRDYKVNFFTLASLIKDSTFKTPNDIITKTFEKIHIVMEKAEEIDRDGGKSLEYLPIVHFADIEVKKINEFVVSYPKYLEKINMDYGYIDGGETLQVKTGRVYGNLRGFVGEMAENLDKGRISEVVGVGNVDGVYSEIEGRRIQEADERRLREAAERERRRQEAEAARLEHLRRSYANGAHSGMLNGRMGHGRSMIHSGMDPMGLGDPRFDDPRKDLGGISRQTLLDMLQKSQSLHANVIDKFTHIINSIKNADNDDKWQQTILLAINYKDFFSNAYSNVQHFQSLYKNKSLTPLLNDIAFVCHFIIELIDNKKPTKDGVMSDINTKIISNIGVYYGTEKLKNIVNTLTDEAPDTSAAEAAAQAARERAIAALAEQERLAQLEKDRIAAEKLEKDKVIGEIAKVKADANALKRQITALSKEATDGKAAEPAKGAEYDALITLIGTADVAANTAITDGGLATAGATAGADKATLEGLLEAAKISLQKATEEFGKATTKDREIKAAAAAAASTGGPNADDLKLIEFDGDKVKLPRPIDLADPNKNFPVDANSTQELLYYGKLYNLEKTSLANIPVEEKKKFTKLTLDYFISPIKYDVSIIEPLTKFQYLTKDYADADADIGIVDFDDFRTSFIKYINDIKNIEIQKLTCAYYPLTLLLLFVDMKYLNDDTRAFLQTNENLHATLYTTSLFRKNLIDNSEGELEYLIKLIENVKSPVYTNKIDDAIKLYVKNNILTKGTTVGGFSKKKILPLQKNLNKFEIKKKKLLNSLTSPKNLNFIEKRRKNKSK